MPEINDRLYNLLPVYYRQRDVEVGEPLRALLQVVSEQVRVVEDDISQRYEDWFIETCEDWVVPYIADLLGYRLPSGAGEPNRQVTPRREVANLIRYRRRKGTLALLELIARDGAGWPARAVEFGRLVGIAQSLHHSRPARGRTADLHRGGELDLLGSPFDMMAHSVDVRRVRSTHSPGRFNTQNVGLFVFRLKSYTITRCEARCMEEGDNAGDACFTFSPLGNDTQLFTKDLADAQPSRFSGELNLPVPIRRRAFEERVPGRRYGMASAAYYGDGKSVAIWAGKEAKQPIPREAIIPADLTGWRYRPPERHVAVDPVLGRIAFHEDEAPGDVIVSYCYGFSDDLGGGEYTRPEFSTQGDRIYTIGSSGGETHSRIRHAVEQWKKDRPARAIIEIADSQTYDEDRIAIDLEEKQFLEFRAAAGARPVLRIVDSESGRAESIAINGKPGSICVFNGILITGRGVHLRGKLDQLILRHCTLVPGWGLHQDCKPRHAAEPSLHVRDCGAHLTIEHSILGPIQVDQQERRNEPSRIQITDSIVDASAPDAKAIWDDNCAVAWVRLNGARCTVIGRIEIHEIELAENCIFTGPITVARRQHGCVRFCYVPPGSRTPRRYKCQPELSGAVPVFNSTRYGTHTYCQLASSCPEEIRKGADDESEMGVFHDLFQSSRRATLLARLEEYVPADSQVGILFAT